MQPSFHRPCGLLSRPLAESLFPPGELPGGISCLSTCLLLAPVWFPHQLIFVQALALVKTRVWPTFSSPSTALWKLEGPSL